MPAVLRALAALTVLTTSSSNAMALDVEGLWDYSKPEQSEQRFLAALKDAKGDERLILETQIARTHGLRKEFAQAREILSAVGMRQESASPEVQVRYSLELGRTFASATHSKDLLTPQALRAARTHFMRAYDLAAGARLDYLAIDALHMMAFVDTEPDLQLEWDRKALAFMERSEQADARRWEGPLRNNVGYALHSKGEYESALTQFRLSRAAYERAGRTRNVRIADWMIAWTYRAQKKYAEAIAIQLDLERAWEADGDPDPDVFEELELLYKAIGDESRARHYAAKAQKISAR
jgi:hypothetical protein